MKVIEQFIKNKAKMIKQAVDVKIHWFAKRTRRMLWQTAFIGVAFVATAGTTVYVAADAVLPHVHNIYSAAKLVDGEARGETRRGQKAVFASILTRMEDKRWPATFHGVMYQPYSNTDKVLQYNAMGDAVHEDLSTDLGQSILVRVAIWYAEYQLGIFQAPKEARGAHSYCVPAACERQASYFGRLDRIGQIGNHVFYGDVDRAVKRVADNLAPLTSPRPVPRPVLCDEESLAPCTSPRPMDRPQSPFLPEQSGKEIDLLVATLVATN